MKTTCGSWASSDAAARGRPLGWGLFFLALLSGLVEGRAAERRTRNVFLITTDGLRWEEVFRGADEALLNKEYGNIGDTNAVRREFWSTKAEERRSLLFPFLWGTVAKRGQLWGNRGLGSEVRVSNGLNFSYPGYSELLTGVVDPAIGSNDKVLNANTNVFEWLHGRPGFAGKVVATVNWDVLPWILNAPRAGFPVWSGFDVPPGTRRYEALEPLGELVEHGRTIWSGVLLDTFVRGAAMDAVKRMKPRAAYISFGETDDWAHEARYERVLRSAHEFDRFVGDLWRLVQSMPEYRDTTTFVMTVDHGRGPAPVAWKDHGRALPDSAYIWFGVLGPDTPALGERRNTPIIRQAQVAATVAAAVGENFLSANPKAAKPVTEVVSGAVSRTAGE